MRPVSDRWQDAILSDHTPVTEAVMVDTGEPVPIEDDSSVTLDITAATRGTCDLVVTDPDWIPTSTASRLAPYGNEIQVSRGLMYNDGEKELISLGKFRIETTKINNSSTGVEIRITGLDRSAKVIDAQFETADTIAGGTDYLTAIINGIKEADPLVEWNFDSRIAQTPLLTRDKGGDRWAFYQDMAAAIGMDLYYDNDGILVLKAIQQVNTTPVAYIVEGESGIDVKPSLLDIGKEWTRTDAHNKWIVDGDNPDVDVPPRGEAVDDNPNSPTYYGEPFGKKPEFYSSSFLSTSAQAQDAANGKKAKEIGTSQTVDFGALVNPALEPTDVVRIKRTVQDPLRPDTLIPIADENHILDSLVIPADPTGNMTGTTRAALVV